MRSPTSPTAIQLREIPPEGLRRAYDLSGEFAAGALEGTEVTPEGSQVAAELELHKSGVEVLARGRITGRLSVLCSRCVGAATVALDSPVQVLFLPRGAQERGAAEGEDVDQPDVVHYLDDEIDIGETLREELLLALPIAPLCNEACKGLCARCGKDLNEGPCDCPEESQDDRWSSLRNVKLD